MKATDAYTAGQKAQMLLSVQTMNGLRLTGMITIPNSLVYWQMSLLSVLFFIIVKSFLELGPTLLKDENAKFLLTERFCQDPLKSYFGDQRSRGARNSNPSAKQFCTTANILRVSSGLSKQGKGNVRGREFESAQDTETKLHKRKQERRLTL